MTKCENCNKAKLILDKKPQEIHCTIMDKSYNRMCEKPTPLEVG